MKNFNENPGSFEQFFDSETAQIYERMISRLSIPGNSFLDREDLRQEVFVTWLEIQRDYGNNPDFIKILSKSIKLHILTLRRQRLRFPIPGKNIIREDQPTESRHAENLDFLYKFAEIQMDDKFHMESMLKEIQEGLKEETYKVFQELWEPSKTTREIAQKRFRKKENLRKQGQHVGGLKELKVTQRDIMRGLKMGCGRYYKCLREIRQVVKFVLEKHRGI